MLLRLLSYRMTLILFTVFAGKSCSAVNLLPQDFYANFSGDPITGDAPHDMFMRQVLHHNGASCGTVHNRTAQRALILSFITGKCTTGRVHVLTFSQREQRQKGLKICFQDMKNLGSIQPNHI
jgi:hypothetical protein